MGFVENDEVVWKKITAFPLCLLVRTSQKHEEQCVIDDNHVRREKPFPRLLVKAIRLSATFRRTNMLLAANLHPNLWVWLECQIAERTVAGRARPFREFRQLILLRPGEKLVLLLEGAFQPPRAEIILPPFHE